MERKSRDHGGAWVPSGARGLDEVQARVAALVRRTGLRGLDAAGVAAEIEEKWLLEGARAAPYISPAPPTLLDVRCAVATWRRRERRTHAREAEVGATVRVDGDPAALLLREEERRAVAAAMRSALDRLAVDDLQALAMKARGATHAEIAARLGGTRSHWGRREREIRSRLRNALGAAGESQVASARTLLDAFREALELSCSAAGVGSAMTPEDRKTPS